MDTIQDIRIDKNLTKNEKEWYKGSRQPLIRIRVVKKEEEKLQKR